jgi:membrane protein
MTIKKNLWKLKFYYSHFIFSLNQHRFLSLCATTSFYFLLTLIPFIILIFLLFSGWVSNSEIIYLELHNITNNLVPEISETIMEQVKAFTNKDLRIGMIWFFILFWAASPLASSLRKNFQIIFNVKIKRKFFVNKIIDIVVLLLIIFLFFIYLFVSNYLQEFTLLFNNFFVAKENTSIFIALSSLLLIIILTLFFKLMTPSKSISLITIIIGAGITCLIWISLNEMFDSIIRMSEPYGIFYGSMRNLFISIIWLFLNIAALLLGIELIAFFHNREIFKYKMLLLSPNKTLLRYFFLNQEVRERKNDVIFCSDTQASYVFFIVEGQIEIKINSLIKVLHNNQYFGEISVIDNSKRVGHAKVLSDWAKIIRIPKRIFKKLLDDDAEFKNNVLKNLNQIIIG